MLSVSRASDGIRVSVIGYNPVGLEYVRTDQLQEVLSVDVIVRDPVD